MESASLPWQYVEIAIINLEQSQVTGQPVSRRTRLLAISAFGAWLAAIGFGLSRLAVYSSTPGRTATTLAEYWPSDQEPLACDANGYSVVMFVHPKCPCTRASLRELGRLLATFPKLAVEFYVYAPMDMPTEWTRTDLWNSAQKLTPQPLRLDSDGALAKRLSATTSGHVFVVRSDGWIAYSGGLTSARGHEGDNLGRSTVTRILSRPPKDISNHHQLPVFGCELTFCPTGVLTPAHSSEPSERMEGHYAANSR